MHTGNSSPTGLWWMSVIGAAGRASLDLFPFAISRNSSVYSCVFGCHSGVFFVTRSRCCTHTFFIYQTNESVHTNQTYKKKEVKQKKERTKVENQKKSYESNGDPMKIGFACNKTIRIQIGKKEIQSNYLFIYSCFSIIFSMFNTYNKVRPIHRHIHSMVV